MRLNRTHSIHSSRDYSSESTFFQSNILIFVRLLFKATFKCLRFLTRDLATKYSVNFIVNNKHGNDDDKDCDNDDNNDDDDDDDDTTTTMMMIMMFIFWCFSV